jgi:hypothetical protein
MFVKRFFTHEIVFSWPERKQRPDSKRSKHRMEHAIGGSAPRFGNNFGRQYGPVG